MNTGPSNRHQPGRRRSSGPLWALAGFGAIALFFALAEHRAHLFGVLPFILLALCPLLHIFHHGHGHGHDGKSPPSARTTAKPLKNDPPPSAGSAAAHHHH